MKKNKLKIFLLTLVLSIIILILYTNIRDYYIVKGNKENKLEAFTINQDGEEIKNRD